MDTVSYSCAREIAGDLSPYFPQGTKRYWEKAKPSFLRFMLFRDFKVEETMAPDWEELRICLSKFNPSLKTLVEFEGIESIDDYAKKLVKYIKEKMSDQKQADSNGSIFIYTFVGQ